MFDSKPISTPLPTDHYLKLLDDTPLIDATEFRQVGNQDDRTSTNAYVIFLETNAISWCSRKQKPVARSSIDEEYRVVALVASKVLWFSSLLRELSIVDANLPTIYCDNVGATYLCYSLVFSLENEAYNNWFPLRS
ncbi:hypothetical protein Ddye_019787 [Dipteronia dyeriana]|uniref:Uncharacterized protein n=1 Tax=Dipteronia dyeriana TaxID=168575 RepID=A0AAD9TZ22_9ROSI|nr:hypothetical protein Ddye_019787 [Dipteronia dyeriana]